MIDYKLFLTGGLSILGLLAVSQTQGCSSWTVMKYMTQVASLPANQDQNRVPAIENTAYAAFGDSNVTFQKEDRDRIEALLGEAMQLKSKTSGEWMLWFGKKFVGVPYVGGTLDRAKEEKLVVNTTELDCTTFVEMVTALTLCAEKKESSFRSYCENLKNVRYIDGDMAYEKRQHYFTAWILHNAKEGLVEDIQANPPFTATQCIQVNWMTTHQDSYKMLKGNASRLNGIKRLEESINGMSLRYIPKGSIANNVLFRETIHDGDIIAIITNKKGLDTTHIGIASWHKDGLHLLNASSIHKKVIDEPMTLRTYMSKHPSQVGIRVCRVRER